MVVVDDRVVVAVAVAIVVAVVAAVIVIAVTLLWDSVIVVVDTEMPDAAIEAL